MLGSLVRDSALGGNNSCSVEVTVESSDIETRSSALASGILVCVAIALAPAALGQGTRVNAPVVSGGYVGFWEIAADGSRVFYAGWQTTVGTNEVHDVPLDGSQATRILSAPFAPGRSCNPFVSFRVAPDETAVLYLADHDTDEMVELYSVPTDGSRVSTKLSGAMIPAGDVQFDFRWTPDGTRVLYRADATQDL